MFLSSNFVWYSRKIIIGCKSFFKIIWAEPQKNSFTGVCILIIRDESLKYFICSPCLYFSWLFSLLYLSISVNFLCCMLQVWNQLARQYFKTVWQCFLNIIRLIAYKLRSLLCTQKQNIKSNWQRLRSLTINQE